MKRHSFLCILGNHIKNKEKNERFCKRRRACAIFRRTGFHYVSLLGQKTFSRRTYGLLLLWAATFTGSGKCTTYCRNGQVSFQVLDTPIISQLAPNSLTDLSLEMDEEKPANSYPNTFVPGRNMLFLTCAAAIAYAKNIRHLVTGVSQTDYSGYPDCRDTFIRSLNVSLNLAMERQFVIHTPLMWRTKAQVWQLADELGVFDLVRNETLTCYNGIKAEGCGHCPACKLRNKGLEEYLSFKEKNKK
jgi:7-cyano-7-deazaguanine synthase